MTGAMVEGWLASGFPASAITAYGPREKVVPEGMRFTTVIPDGPFDALVLGFKPQLLDEIAPDLAPRDSQSGRGQQEQQQQSTKADAANEGADDA